MRKIFTLLLLLIPLWMQAQEGYTWDEGTKTLTIKTDIPYDNTYEAAAETLIIEGTYTTIGSIEGQEKNYNLILLNCVFSKIFRNVALAVGLCIRPLAVLLLNNIQH